MTSAGIDAIFTPAGKRTRTALLKEFSVPPSPSWPCVPRPQAYRLPLASSAYWVEFEVPTSATVPGTVTAAGDITVPKGPFPLRPAPKKDPQCLTVAVDDSLAVAVDDRRSDEQPPARIAAAATTHRPAPTCSELPATICNDFFINLGLSRATWPDWSSL